MAFTCSIAVSYKHLDVYKRQTVDSIATLELYIYLFYEYVGGLPLIFVPSNKESNRYGLPNGKQKSGEYNISYEPIDN